MVVLTGVISIDNVFAVDFVDHTGYIPDWAVNIGETQALATCSNMEYGTLDQKWCTEYTGYYNDKITEELDAINYDDESIDDSLFNSNYVPQFNKKIFDDNPKQIPHTSYVNQLYDFSLIPPPNWSTNENMELVGGEEAAPVGFYSNNFNSDYTANFLVLYRSLGSSYFDLLQLSSDNDVLDSMASGLGSESSTKINNKKIESYLDGYKITLEFVETKKIDDGKFISLQRESIMYILDSGDVYFLNFASTIDDFNNNVDKFRKSSKTFHVGEVEFVENTPSTKQENPPIYQTKNSNAESICGQGTELVNGICQVITSEEKSKGGGCLIATATYGSELAPQVQQLRELRDNSLLQTESGTSFMTGFNQFYYSFSPTVADWERENPLFKEAVKITITPMLSTLSIMTLSEDGSESEVLGLGLSVIALNIGMYFVAPTIVIVGIRKKFNTN